MRKLSRALNVKLKVQPQNHSTTHKPTLGFSTTRETSPQPPSPALPHVLWICPHICRELTAAVFCAILPDPAAALSLRADPRSPAPHPTPTPCVPAASLPLSPRTGFLSLFPSGFFPLLSNATEITTLKAIRETHGPKSSKDPLVAFLTSILKLAFPLPTGALHITKSLLATSVAAGQAGWDPGPTLPSAQSGGRSFRLQLLFPSGCLALLALHLPHTGSESHTSLQAAASRLVTPAVLINQVSLQSDSLPSPRLQTGPSPWVRQKPQTRDALRRNHRPFPHSLLLEPPPVTFHSPWLAPTAAWTLSLKVSPSILMGLLSVFPARS